MSVIIDLLDTSISPEEISLLQHPNTSGVILFTRNIKDRESLIALTEHIHQVNPTLPLFIDHEGGYVQRIQRLGFTPLPAARLYGEVYDLNPEVGLKLAKQYGEIMAKDLRACGIHVGLAPVLDIAGPNPIIAGLHRAFHQNPDIITALAGAFIEGMKKAGMPSIGKHFPGHGFCTTDSHIDFPTDSRTLEALNATDLKPFKALSASHLLDAIMPAHITYPKIDPNHAAGYSSIWLKEILQTQIQFDGLIMSDCLGMTGADIGDLLTRGKQALDAGCHLLIAANQTRPVLKNFLDTLPTDYLDKNQSIVADFKAKIMPIPTETYQITSEERQTQNKNPANPTETI